MRTKSPSRRLSMGMLPLCKFLCPPKKAVPRHHCNTEDGKEGDCPIILGKSEECQFMEESGMAQSTKSKKPQIADWIGKPSQLWHWVKKRI